jgi:hypothetical protein
MSKDFDAWKTEKDTLLSETSSKIAAEQAAKAAEAASKSIAAQAAFERWVVDKGVLDRAWEVSAQRRV